MTVCNGAFSSTSGTHEHDGKRFTDVGFQEEGLNDGVLGLNNHVTWLDGWIQLSFSDYMEIA